MSEPTQNPEMTFADQKLVESVKANPSPANMAEMVTEVYRMNVGQINSIECLASGQKTLREGQQMLADVHAVLAKAVGDIKTQIKDEIHPQLAKFSDSEKWGKIIIRGSLGILAACGVSVGGWFWTSGQQAVYLAKLNDEKVKDLAGEVVDSKLEKQNFEMKASLAENAARLETRTFELRAEFKDALSSPEHQRSTTKKP